MERREFIPFLGSKGSGKSSLIKALFPQLEVDYSEPRFYRDYFVGEGRYVRELSGSEETIRFLLPAMSKWRVSKAVVVLDLSKKESLSWAVGTMPLLGWEYLLVGNKADLPELEVKVEDVRSLAERRGAKLFVVSALTGEGTEVLRRVLVGEIPLEEVPKPPAPPRVERVPAVAILSLIHI